MINLKQSKGITLVTLILAIVIMLIISSVILYNANAGINTRKLNNMFNDIEIIKNKVDIYYAKYGALPIIKTLYTNVENLKNININDSENYYVVDLEALENITLTYGKDYKAYKETPSDAKIDLYIINEQSHTIYYVAGVKLDEKTYYTTVSDYTKVETSTKCNHPKLGVGMTPVKWNGTEFIETESYDPEWYEYIDTSVEGQENNSQWANAKTKDGSMWVWIPRYAYKINYTDESDKSLGGTIDVVFLKNDTNYDFNDKDVTDTNYIDEKGKKGAYIVHPAFQDGTINDFANGEWDKEITGFWMAKFEAGYAGTAGDVSTATDSTVPLSVIYAYQGNSIYEELTTNYYGTRAIGDLIKYPVFQANRPSMNYLGISDAYDLSKSLTATGNPYGLTSSVDSHLTKNSEWGAVAYLTHSKYGRNGQEVTINNVSVENENTIYAVTGYGASSVSAEQDITRNLATLTNANQTGNWTTSQGQLATSTGNIYGIYDLSGGLLEWTAGYVATAGNYQDYGGSLKGESNRYKSKYAGTSETDTENYNASPNPTRLGEAIWETSSQGTGTKSWNSDYSCFWYTPLPFSIRGCGWNYATDAGVFAFFRSRGYCRYHVGFRPVLVVE